LNDQEKRELNFNTNLIPFADYDLFYVRLALNFMIPLTMAVCWNIFRIIFYFIFPHYWQKKLNQGKLWCL